MWKIKIECIWLKKEINVLERGFGKKMRNKKEFWCFILEARLSLIF